MSAFGVTADITIERRSAPRVCLAGRPESREYSPQFGSHPANPGYISRRGRHNSMPWTNQGGGGFSGFFRVEPDELGVVLRFGKAVREVQPGLNYHLPYPIETVLTPKALRVNKIDIGMRVVDDIRRGGTTVRDVPEESLMLTGDENI